MMVRCQLFCVKTNLIFLGSSLENVILSNFYCNLSRLICIDLLKLYSLLMICMSDNISTMSSKSMRFLSVDNIDRLGTVRRKGRGIIL